MGRQSRKLQPAMSLFVAVVVNRCLFKNHASLQRRFVMATALVRIGKVHVICALLDFFGLEKIDEKNRETERKIDHFTSTKYSIHGLFWRCEDPLTCSPIVSPQCRPLSRH